MEITFWGVRGSKPAPHRNYLQFGGNTSCVQIDVNGRRLIFDGGTGLADLGNTLNPKNADIFFSHLHWDHIQGIPFFVPLYAPGNDFRLYGADKKTLTFREVLELQMKPPHFPITMGVMQSNISFISVTTGQLIDLGDGITVKTFAVNHPNGCLAYRVEYKQSSVVYCTDTEPIDGAWEDKFMQFLSGADILIYDSHFTNQEYYGDGDDPLKKGWGHSTWQEGVRICRHADIFYYVMFHHKENRTDNEQLELEQQAKTLFPNTVAAREGMTIKLEDITNEEADQVIINYP